MDDLFIRRFIKEWYNAGQRFFCLRLVLLLNRLPHLFDHSLDAGLQVTVSHAAGFVLSHPFFSRLMYSQEVPPCFSVLRRIYLTSFLLLVKDFPSTKKKAASHAEEAAFVPV
jgi:hypothetical protein